jgi:hypothetical protein
MCSSRVTLGNSLLSFVKWTMTTYDVVLLCLATLAA